MDKTKTYIAFINLYFGIGGIESSTINLLNLIDYDRFDVDLYILSNSHALVHEINPNVRVEFHISPIEKMRSKLTSKLSGTTQKVFLAIINLFSYLLTKGSLFMNLVIGSPIDKRYDAVFVQYPGRTQLFALKNLKSRRKYAFYHHGNIEVFNKCNRLFDQFDGIITVSDKMSKLITYHYPEYERKVSVIHNIIPINEIVSKSRLFETRFVKKRGHHIIVSCGRLAIEKGFDLAIEAARILAEMKNLDFIWYFIGNGPERQRLEGDIESFGLKDRIVLLGGKQNPYPYISDCDYYVQPSRVESYGLSIVEAQVLGKAVIATRTLGAEEVIEDGVTGVICEISAQSISDSIAMLISNRQLKSKIEEAALRIDFIGRNSKALSDFNKLIYS